MNHDPSLAEVMLIAACHTGGVRTLDEVADVLQPDSFFDPRRAALFSAMLQASERGMSLNVLSVAGILANMPGGGDNPQDFVGEMFQWVLPADALHWAKRIVGHAQIRRLISTAQQIAKDAANADPIDADEVVNRSIDAMMTTFESRTPIVEVSAKIELREVVAEVKAIKAGTFTAPGSPTGLDDLDELTGGLRPQELVILGGHSGTGKTAFVVHLASAIAKAGGLVLYVSMEVPARQIVRRLVASEARVNSRNLDRAPGLCGGDDDKFIMGVQRMSSWVDNIRILDVSSATIPMVARRVRRLNRGDQKVAAVVLDYGQKVRPVRSHKSREQEVAEVATDAEAMAKDFNLCAIVPLQFNRDGMKRGGDKRPQMSDIRESAQWEQNAQVGLLLHRPCLYNEKAPKNVAEIIVGKNRNGPMGRIVSIFYEETQNRFGNLQRERF